jgi:hypothetical protein
MPTAITALPEYGSLDAVPLSAGDSLRAFAWLATDLADVRMPARLRGGDDIKPKTHGVSVNPRWRTASRRLIPILFAGDTDSDGAPSALTAAEQVWVNLDEFSGLVMEPDILTPTRTLTVVHGSLTWTGEVVVEDFEFEMRAGGATTAEIIGVLDVSIVAGRLVLAGGS